MSASLVGSEMCIRDSRSAEGLPETVHRSPDAARATRMPWLPNAPTEMGSVSYTHLTLPTICSV
eukprot:12908773-Alexandrium_andersonii.AAC.1